MSHSSLLAFHNETASLHVISYTHTARADLAVILGQETLHQPGIARERVAEGARRLRRLVRAETCVVSDVSPLSRPPDHGLRQFQRLEIACRG